MKIFFPLIQSVIINWFNSEIYFFTGKSVKKQTTDSICENLTDSNWESSEMWTCKNTWSHWKKTDELVVTVQGMRKTRSKGLLVKLKCSKVGRGRLDTALKEVVGASETVRHLVSRIEDEIADIEPSVETGDVEDAVSGFFEHGSVLELKLFREASPKRKPSRGRVWTQAGSKRGRRSSA